MSLIHTTHRSHPHWQRSVLHLESLEDRTVPAGPLSSVTGVSFTAGVNVPLNNTTIATFVVPDGVQFPSVTVNWGDGTSLTLDAYPWDFSPIAGNAYAVRIMAPSGLAPSPGKTYTAVGTYTVATEFTVGSNAPQTATSTATVVQSPQGLTGMDFNAYEYTPIINKVIATFTGSPVASAFTAYVNWGDGTSTGPLGPQFGEQATVVQIGPNFRVVGSHTYCDEGMYTPTVTVFGGSQMVQTNATADVQEELVPDGTTGSPANRFVAELYRDLLGRKVDAGGLANWSHQLEGLIVQGVPLAQAESTITLGIEMDPQHEYLDGVVAGFYRQYLGRAVGPSDGANPAIFANMIAASVAHHPQTLDYGSTQVRIVFLTSAEYVTKHPGGTAAWVDGLYHDVLGRTSTTDTGAANFVQALNQGLLSPVQVAADVLLSAEATMDRATVDYLQYLDRPVGLFDPLRVEWLASQVHSDQPSLYYLQALARAGGQSDLPHVQWLAQQIQAGLPEEMVIAEIVGDVGQEFFGRVNPTCRAA